MFEQILQTIGSAITAVIMAITGLFSPAPAPEPLPSLDQMEQQVSELQLKVNNLLEQISQEGLTLGSFTPATGGYYRLWGSGITSSATTLVLQSFKVPINDQEMTMAYLGLAREKIVP